MAFPIVCAVRAGAPAAPAPSQAPFRYSRNGGEPGAKHHKQIPSQSQPSLNKVRSASAAGVQHCLSAYPMFSILLGLTGVIGTCSLLCQRQLLSLHLEACMYRQMFS